MTKQEVIQQAYGEYWKDYGHLVDENGAIFQSDLFYPDTEMSAKIGIEIDIIVVPEKKKWSNIKWRPKSLKGIENNNGWILIWEKRLPFSNVACHFVSKEIIYTGIFVFQTRKFIDNTGKAHSINDVTHYQLIENPKPPIY